MAVASDTRAVRFRLGELSALQIRLHWIYEGAVPAEWRENVVRGVPSFAAWLVLEGSAEVEGAGRKLKAGAGEWLIPMLPPRRQRFSADARLISLSFQLSWPSGEPLFPHGTGFAFPARKFPGLERHARQLLRAVRSQSPRTATEFTGSQVTLAAYLRLHQHLAAWIESFVDVLRAFGCAPSRLGPSDERLPRAMAVLDEWPAGGSHTRLAAAAAGLSLSQLDRLFIRHFGLTPKGYIDQKRIQSACAALENSGVPIKEIGYSLGFRQPSQFTAWFRRHQSLSPRAYRAARTGREE